MNHVGLLLCRNEVDILPEWLAHIREYFSSIVAVDGSDDGSRELLRQCDFIVKLFTDDELAAGRMTDGHRNEALQWIRAEFLDAWVTLLHPDEFWFDAPDEMVGRAHAAGATYVIWGEYRFFLHLLNCAQSALLVTGHRSLVTDHLCWYCGPFFEVRQFNAAVHQVYLPGQNHCTLPSGPEPGRRWPHIPRYRHYPYRSPEQIMKRAAELRAGKRLVQPDHDWTLTITKPEECYRACLPKPHNSPLAARTWNRVEHFDGNLPNPLRFFPPDWRG